MKASAKTKITHASAFQVTDEKAPPVHIRRCHLCGELSEHTEEVVTKCDGCGKFMAPFYFFNEVETITLTDHMVHPDPRTPQELGEHRLPIRGFTAFW